MDRSILTEANTVTISSKYQIVIPREIRSAQGWKPGDKLIVLRVDGRVELVKLVPLMSLLGAAKGINSDFIREEDERF